MQLELAETYLRQVITRSGSLLQQLSSEVTLPTTKLQPRAYDLIVNDFIINSIREQYPSHDFISEEGPAGHLGGSGFTWVIDPIDGSDNFMRGIHAYTISISLFQASEIILGSVFEPYLNRLFMAVRGKGATVNGRPLHVSSVEDLATALVATSTYQSFVSRSASRRSSFHQVVEKTNARISASTALDMCYVALGSFDARIMADTRVWDNSAASLLVQEAGGRVTDWEGNENNYESSELVASNGACHDKLLELLKGYRI
jgi:myo-inositol-1(or 4)-monophosphatase